MSSSSSSVLQSTLKLSTGADLPLVGFGTWRSAPKDTENSVYTALQAGYRHIDCARIYANEKVRMAAQCATLGGAYAAACEVVHFPSLRRVDGFSVTAWRG